MAQSAAARDTLAQQVRDAEGALDQAQQDWAAGAAAAAEPIHPTRSGARRHARRGDRDPADARAPARRGRGRAGSTPNSAPRPNSWPPRTRRSARVRSKSGSLRKSPTATPSRSSLADAQTALQEAERRQASQMTTAAAQLAERQAEHDAEMAQSAAARDTLAQQVRDAEGASTGPAGLGGRHGCRGRPIHATRSGARRHARRGDRDPAHARAPARRRRDRAGARRTARLGRTAGRRARFAAPG